MTGYAQCPTCGAAIAVGVPACTACGTRLSWGVPGAAPPPPAPYRAQAHHAPVKHHPAGVRRGGDSAALWVMAAALVALLGGGYVFWQVKGGHSQGANQGPEIVPAGGGASHPGGGALPPFLDRFAESYPRFFQDLAYDAPPAPTLPPPKSYSHRRSISSEYDRFRDCTFFLLHPFVMDVTSVPGGGAAPQHTLAAFAGIRGSTSKGVPHLVTLVFDVDASTAPYGENTTLSFKADGATLPQGRAAWITSLEGKDKTTQSLLYPVKTSVLIKLTDAKDVHGKLGTTEFDLPEEDLEALRDFMSRIGPGGH